MAEQLDWVSARPLARRSDPHTSHAAAARVASFGDSHCDRVLSALQRFGRAGAEQLGAATKLEPYSVRKRLADLKRRGLAMPTPETRFTISGREERVWVASA